MSVTINHTLLAYLLALKDQSVALSTSDKENLQEFAKEFRSSHPDELESDIEPLLKETIAENGQLNQLFQTYHQKLSLLTEIPPNLLPNFDSLNQLEQQLNNQSSQLAKSDIPDIPDDTTPEGQAAILNNSVILISESEEPEKSTEQLQWIDKLKQWLG